MTRRVALALFAALASLAVPSAASALQHTDATASHPAAPTALAPRHATVVHIALAERGGHEGRAPHHSHGAPAVLGRFATVAPAYAWAHLAWGSSSQTRERPSSSRPRAPPAVV